MEAVLREIRGVDFGVLGPEDILDLSKVHITSHACSDSTAADGIMVGGLFDLRMGPTKLGQSCQSCQCDRDSCPGHFGHMDLACPIAHRFFLPSLLFLVRCTCAHCGHLLVVPTSNFPRTRLNSPHKQKQLWEYIYSNAHKEHGHIKCTREECDMFQPTYQIERGLWVSWCYSEDLEVPSYLPRQSSCTIQLLQQVRRIPDSVHALLGFHLQRAHPTNFLLRVLPIAPPCTRTSVDMGNGIFSHDDLTIKYSDLVKINQALNHHIARGAPPHVQEELRSLLAYHVGTLLDNGGAGLQQSLHRNGKPLLSLSCRLKGKGGRIRNNIMGKRGDYSARSVITGDPTIALHEIGLPQAMAMQLTFPERVCRPPAHPLVAICEAYSRGVVCVAGSQCRRLHVCPHLVRYGRCIQNICRLAHPCLLFLRGTCAAAARSAAQHAPHDCHEASKCSSLGQPQLLSNFASLQAAVQNGPHLYPGANTVRCALDGKIIHLAKLQKPYLLKNGDIVERHLVKGDVVLVNRQPSLHKASIMAHLVRVLVEGSTIRLNVSATAPYNADFDGDEMNIHVPQTQPSRAEALAIMAVPQQIVLPQGNRPCMGIIQDALLGVHVLSRRDTFLTREHVYQMVWLLQDFRPDELVEVPPPALRCRTGGGSGAWQCLWTGKQILSLLLPSSTNVQKLAAQHAEGERPFFSEGDTSVVIDGGHLLAGTLEKGLVGATCGSLVHILWLDHGPARCTRFINELQVVANYFLLHRSFSVGIADLILPRAVIPLIKAPLVAVKETVQEIIRQGQRGLLVRRPGLTLSESRERGILEAVETANASLMKQLLQRVPATNGLATMARCGSKGNQINLCQIMVLLGQQYVQGARIKPGFTASRRPLPHFKRDDVGVESGGMITHSFVQGLTPSQFFFHTMAGREGLVDTAVKTADCGYLQRKLVKSLENLQVGYDGRVSDAEECVIQFQYGEDGLAAEYLEPQHFHMLPFFPTFMHHYETPKHGAFMVQALRERQDGVGVFTPDEMLLLDEVLQLRADEANLQRHWSKLEELAAGNQAATTTTTTTTAHTILLPFHFYRLVREAQVRIDDDDSHDPPPPLTITCIIRLVKSWLRDELTTTNPLHHSILRYLLASKRVLVQWQLTASGLQYLLRRIGQCYRRAQIAAGEMVGGIAAQSLGETGTQLNLNSFHYSGVKNSLSTMAMLQEIISVTRSPKQTYMTLPLLSTVAYDEATTWSVLCAIEHRILRDWVVTAQVRFEQPLDDCSEQSPHLEDITLMRTYHSWPEDQPLSSWFFRLVLDGKRLRLQQQTLAAIVSRLRELRLLGVIIASPEEQEWPVLRLYLPVYTVPPPETEHQRQSKAKAAEKAQAQKERRSAKLVRARARDEQNFEREVRKRRKLPAASSSSSSSKNDGGDLVVVEAMAVEDVMDGGGGGSTAASEEREPIVYQYEALVRLLETSILLLHCGGTPGLSSLSFRRGLGGNQQHNGGEWVIDAYGSRMRSVMALAADLGVDSTRVQSSDLWDVFHTLGIEAVRGLLLQQLRLVVSSGGSYINYRHLLLIVDAMCASGQPLAMSRHGLISANPSALHKASFEMPVTCFVEAARLGQRDTARNLSADTILGRLSRIGTTRSTIHLTSSSSSQKESFISPPNSDVAHLAPHLQAILEHYPHGRPPERTPLVFQPPPPVLERGVNATQISAQQNATYWPYCVEGYADYYAQSPAEEAVVVHDWNPEHFTNASPFAGAGITAEHYQHFAATTTTSVEEAQWLLRDYRTADIIIGGGGGGEMSVQEFSYGTTTEECGEAEAAMVVSTPPPPQEEEYDPEYDPFYYADQEDYYVPK